ncbi:MAG: UDP-glucose 4-epimerase [Pseudonocardiales bacterium]|nr:UDP-glucose 4-epimerase [Pseudonocardiales bacterium]
MEGVLTPADVLREIEPVLVIGAGFMGTAVARALIERGLPVNVLTRSPASLHAVDSAMAPRLLFDDLTTSGVVDLIAAHRHVVLAAGGASPAVSNGYTAATLHSELELLELILSAARVRLGQGLTYLSSGGAVYGDAPTVPTPESCRSVPISDYGYAKLAGEELVRVGVEEYGVRARIMRVANAYGPGQPSAGVQGVVGAAFRAAMTGEPMMLVDGGRVVRDFVYVDDVVTAILATMDLAEDIAVLNVGSGVGTSIAEVVRLVTAVTGLTVPTFMEDTRPFDVRPSVLDIRELQRRVAFVPTTLENGLERTWANACDSRLRA